jgi:glyoxylase-like metal-dependent hydrolase (beta-lactamase superfamily II)
VKTFTLQEVGSGVWAAIAEPGGVAVGNAGVVDLGDQTLVFDTTISLTAARELRAAAERAGALGTVVYSHWHGDHVYGAGAMPADALVVATARTAALMEERAAERLRQLKADPPSDGPFAELAATEIPRLELIYPDETFAAERSFVGEQRSAQAISYGGGHTLSDAFLWLGEEKILFAADLVVNGTHPWVGDGDVRAWPGILERIAELGPETIVPGHGPVAGPDAIDFMLGYLQDLSRADPGSPAPDRYASLANPNGWTRNVEAAAAQRVRS